MFFNCRQTPILIVVHHARGVLNDAGAPPPKAPEPNPPRKIRFKIRDRVTTSHGTGTVVEIDGEKYLVDLDGQGAKLWTKDWALQNEGDLHHQARDSRLGEPRRNFFKEV